MPNRTGKCETPKIRILGTRSPALEVSDAVQSQTENDIFSAWFGLVFCLELARRKSGRLNPSVLSRKSKATKPRAISGCFRWFTFRPYSMDLIGPKANQMGLVARCLPREILSSENESLWSRLNFIDLIEYFLLRYLKLHHMYN